MIPKFRAWDKNTNDMVDVKTIDFERGGGFGCIVDYNGINLDVSECIIMQSTGLKDKNGVEIFEGDIVLYSSYVNYIFYIGYEHAVYYAYHKYGREYMTPVPIGSLCLSGAIEILGNIHENSEILEGKL